jgi:hypothetical protein
MHAKAHSAIPSVLEAAQRLDRKGIFAGPSECISDFIRDGESYPVVSSSNFLEVRTRLKDMFDVDTSHIAIEKSSKSLLPWEIACCLFNEKAIPSIYVRPGRWFFHSIPEEAIIAHELIHALRGRLDSTVFEEYAAFDGAQYLYPGAVSHLRTLTGPLFTNPFEAIILCILLFIVSLLPWFFAPFATMSVLLPLMAAIVAYPIFRCAYRWRVWNRAKKALGEYSSENAWKILVRLGDKEIFELARLRKGCAAHYIAQKQQASWRWAVFC